MYRERREKIIARTMPRLVLVNMVLLRLRLQKCHLPEKAPDVCASRPRVLGGPNRSRRGLWLLK
jgi:hypothetical protein